MNRPVLVLGTEPRIAVTIARSLHAHGIPVDVAGTGEGARLPRSRAIRRLLRLADPVGSPGEFASALIAGIRARGHDMIIPAGDTTLAALVRLEKELRPLVHLACPPAPAALQALDKDATLAAARRCGVPVPAAIVLDPAVPDLASGVRFPLIAKPITKRRNSEFKTLAIRSAEELRAAFAADPQFGDHNLIQEYCPGVGVGIEVLMHRGEPVALFQHRRLKEYPVSGGVSVLAESVPLDPVLADLVLRLLRELGWDGVAMVEFRHDPDRGATALMEINGRYWGSLALSRFAGVDFPYYEWQLRHGQTPQPPEAYRVGVRMRWTAGALLRLGEALRPATPGATERQSFGRELLGFLGDFRPGTRDALGSMRDPIPGCDEVVRTAAALLKSGLRAVARRLLPRAAVRHIRTGRSLGGRAMQIYLQKQVARSVGLRAGPAPRLTRPPRSVLFICHGNIIRSAMAAALLRALLGPTAVVQVRSAGVAAKDGRGADPLALTLAPAFGVSLDDHRAQSLTDELVRSSDALFVMDYLNEARLLARFPEARRKTWLLGAFDPDHSRSSTEIADPYGKGEEAVRGCFLRLNRCVEQLVHQLACTAPSDATV